MAIKTVVTDLDGTFWSTEMTLHSETVGAVTILDNAGIGLVIATGRRAQSTLMGLRPAGLCSRPSILMNGALVRQRLDGPSFHVSPIETADALRATKLFRDFGLEPLVYVDDPTRDLLAAPNVSAGAEFLASAPGVRHVDDLDEAMKASSVIGFGAFGFAKSMLVELAARIEDDGVGTAIINASHYEGDYGIMVQARDIDKATGLQAMSERGILDLSATAAVGDGFNDVGMLSAAALAIVPNNAPSEVQELADVLIEPNEQGGWKAIPEIIGL